MDKEFIAPPTDDDRMMVNVGKQALILLLCRFKRADALEIIQFFLKNVDRLYGSAPVVDRVKKRVGRPRKERNHE